MEEFDIMKDCSTVVFSNRAYNAIVRESFKKDPVETGGILLGHIVEDTWVVLEVLPPGINSIFEIAYFEYDQDFVNYLADSVANQYKIPLKLLGLWHRHPGNMDKFSHTDDSTNLSFARLNPNGAISGLVNIDPRFRLTMYHLENPRDNNDSRPKYSFVDFEVGDDIIPDVFFELKYVNSEESNLHPLPLNPTETPTDYPIDGNRKTIKQKIGSFLLKHKNIMCAFLLGIFSVFLLKVFINSFESLFNKNDTTIEKIKQGDSDGINKKEKQLNIETINNMIIPKNNQELKAPAPEPPKAEDSDLLPSSEAKEGNKHETDEMSEPHKEEGN